ncbi:hypothetical protein PENANT_c147G05120 [Penicillium antarcticum]|uniref:Uncharacterized protein n=1 Tax=Penicillium antarcticum TaxID=416450 RepID=A0A1V6PEV9_9EURO|nr:hypothetical protein PENANT_c147G05120 [Penicillium antarcticum]
MGTQSGSWVGSGLPSLDPDPGWVWGWVLRKPTY